MSVIVRNKAGEIFLFMKGADDVVFERCTPNKSLEDATRDHINEFSLTGLRVMLVAYKPIDPKFYEEWNIRYQAAANSIQDRDLKLRQLAEDIEYDLELLGSTAIEDQLQEGVPEAISTLSAAGIKIWMLTGDKLETAINVGYSCNLLMPNMEFIRLDEASETLTCMKLAGHLTNYKKLFGKVLISKFILFTFKKNKNIAMLVCGRSLTYIMQKPEWLRVFLELCNISSCIIASRLNPAQKAEVYCYYYFLNNFSWFV